MVSISFLQNRYIRCRRRASASPEATFAGQLLTTIASIFIVTFALTRCSRRNNAVTAELDHRDQGGPPNGASNRNPVAAVTTSHGHRILVRVAIDGMVTERAADAADQYRSCSMSRLLGRGSDDPRRRGAVGIHSRRRRRTTERQFLFRQLIPTTHSRSDRCRPQFPYRHNCRGVPCADQLPCRR